MAQTKRKRRTKHRGTAAGTISTRGRTGRPPTAEEKKKDDRAKQREARLNREPTWKSSVQRALIAATLMFVFILLTARKAGVGGALVFAVLSLALYVPAGYYLELFLYRRRQRRKGVKS